MAKSTEAVQSVQYRHKQPLEDDILATGPLRQKSKKRKARRGDDEEESYVDSKSSRKILKIGRDLQEEDQEISKPEAPNVAFTAASRPAPVDEEIQEDENVEEEAWEDDDIMNSKANVCDVHLMTSFSNKAFKEVDPSELDLFHKFIPAGEQPTLELSSTPNVDEGQRTNLADLILKQIAAHEAAQDREEGLASEDPGDEAIPSKLVEVYTKSVGVLSSEGGD